VRRLNHLRPLLFFGYAAVGWAAACGGGSVNPVTGLFDCAGGVTPSCVGAPGNTVGPYKSQCQAAGGALYTCANAAGCTVAGDWNSVSGAGGAVSSVFTRTGAVVATSGDYTASQVTNAVANNAANTYSGGGLQDLSAMKTKPAATTVASLPAASSNTNVVYMVTDGTSTTDCSTGGASTAAWCRSNGASWLAMAPAPNAAAVLNNQANTYTTGLQSFASGNITLPAGAGFTASSANNIGFDSTNKNVHVWDNADGIVAPFASAPTNGNCVKAGVASGTVTLVDAGAACGSGGGGNASITGTTVSFSATPTFTRSTNLQWFFMTLTGNVTSSTLSGASANDRLCFGITQDATGGRTFAWPTGFSRAPTISPTVSVTTNICGIWDGSNYETDAPAASGDTPFLLSQAPERATPATPAAAFASLWFDSTAHTALSIENNSTNQHKMPRCAGANDTCASTDLSDVSTLVTLTGAQTLTNKTLTNQSLGSNATPSAISQTYTADTAGTTANLICKNSSNNHVVTVGTSDTEAVGICATTQSSGAAVEVYISGAANCVFDNTSTAGDFVQISTGTAGDCHDAGSTLPTSGGVLLGKVIAGGSAGTFPVALQIRTPGSSGGGATAQNGYFWVGDSSCASFCATSYAIAGGSGQANRGFVKLIYIAGPTIFNHVDFYITVACTGTCGVLFGIHSFDKTTIVCKTEVGYNGLSPVTKDPTGTGIKELLFTSGTLVTGNNCSLPQGEYWFWGTSDTTTVTINAQHDLDTTFEGPNSNRYGYVNSLSTGTGSSLAVTGSLPALTSFSNATGFPSVLLNSN
jgi:hypothetical protein